MKDLKNNQLLSNDEYKHLYTSTASSPRFYGLIKTHKTNNPIRPIISFINSPSYKVAQYLSKIPLTNNADQKLKNTYETKDKLSQFIIPIVHVMVSQFMSWCLFTSIPHDLALQCVNEFITEKEDLRFGITRLQNHEIMGLLQLCLEATSFVYNDVQYKQLSGLPMGSPISVVLSEITMQHLEKRSVSHQPVRPLFWFRYIDDCIAALPSTSVDDFLRSTETFSSHANNNRTIELIFWI